MNYSDYNPNQQQQQQSYYEYDPSQYQSQPYDQSYAAAAYHSSYYAAAYNQQYASYYPSSTTDTSSHFQHQQPFLHYQQQPDPVHPPGVNPESVQLPIPNNVPIGPSSPYRGRGGRSFRRGGRGRGQFSHGRGRGMGGGRHFPSHSTGLAVSDVPGASAAAGATVQAPPRKVSCEICKVECNTPEVMETHLKGKKHLKNVRLHEAKQVRNAINGPQSDQISTSHWNSTGQYLITQVSEDPTKNMSSETAADNHKNNVGETSEVPAGETEGLRMENSGARGRGMKRKLRGGKGRKLMRTDGSEPEAVVAITCELCNVKCETQRVYQSHITGKKHLKRAYGHHPPAGVVNQALVGVVNQALAAVGNQASSEVVGPQALSGVVGLQALHPPDINALANQINAQVQQGDNDPQVLLAQLLVNVLTQAQGSATAPANGDPLAAQMPTPAPLAGSSYETQLALTQQASETAAPVGTGNPTGESNHETLSIPVESNVSTQLEGGNSETK